MLAKSRASSQDITVAFQQLLQQLSGVPLQSQLVASPASDSLPDGHDSSADIYQQHSRSYQARRFHAQAGEFGSPAEPNAHLSQQLPGQLPGQLPWLPRSLPPSQRSPPNTSAPSLEADVLQWNSWEAQTTVQTDFPGNESADQDVLQHEQLQQKLQDDAVGPMQMVRVDERLEGILCSTGWEAFQQVIRRRDVGPAWAIIEAMRQVCPGSLSLDYHSL